MDRFMAMLILLWTLVIIILALLAFFYMYPITCSCVLSLLYSLYLFIAYEESGIHHAQEFENRFWTIFALLLSTALFFAADSPLAFGLWSPSLGLLGVVVSGYAMHTWDRYVHRIAISQDVELKRLRRNNHTMNSLLHLQNLGIPVEEQLSIIEQALNDIDQLLIPSTINNFINHRFVLQKEREIITIFEECDARALNYLIGHVKLGLLFYKIKDHHNYKGKHRTELINLLAVDRLSILTVISRVIVLHSLQLLKLRANPRAEYWVRNIILNTHQEQLSELKTLTDAKGDYFCMNKLIYDDVRSESVRQDILKHLRKEAAVQQTHIQMGTSGRHRNQNRQTRYYSTSRFTTSGGISYPVTQHQQYRKVLSDVDDTLYCSGGMYPAGIDKSYPKKAVYPGVLAFYRELDIGTQGPDVWQDEHVGNLVFLSARPHLYKDISEKHNFAKFEKLRSRNADGRSGLHTMPSLLAGDLTSGGQFMFGNDYEPLARKKFDNFRRYVSIYPEYQHVFVCDNGQGDVRAGEMMFDSFPYEFEALYVHIVQDITRTYGYDPKRWMQKEFKPYFFHTYPEAALHAATKRPTPLIRIQGLKRICHDTVKDFAQIKKWPNEILKSFRRQELNQALWRANNFLVSHGEEPEELIHAEQRWDVGQRVRTPYGIGTVKGFVDPVFDLYEVELDWRPLNMQVDEYNEEVKNAVIRPKNVVEKRKSLQPASGAVSTAATAPALLETVTEEDDGDVEDIEQARSTEGTDDASSSQQLPTPTIPPLQNEIAQDTVDVQKTANYGKLQEVGQSSAEEPRKPSKNADLVRRVSAPARIGSPSPADSLVDPEQIAEAIEETKERNDDQPTEEGSSQSTDFTKSKSFVVTAKICGLYITKYTPPVLPKISETAAAKSRTSSSIFTFLQTTGTEAPPKLVVFKEGEDVTTPYGPGRVVEHRSKNRIVVVNMIGWGGRAYLRESDVKLAPKNLIRQFIRQLSSSEKQPEFPHAKGTVIKTPFGKGRVCRPIPLPSSQHHRSGSLVGPNPKATRDSPVATLGISLESWVLADGSHPTLYSTVETARAWKDRKETDTEPSIFSTLGTLVESSKNLLSPFLSQKKVIQGGSKVEKSLLYTQYYQDAAAVTTSFGKGVVVGFRASDGFYEISLLDWTLANGSHPKAYFRKEDISYRIAAGCQEGYPVLTSLGLSGTLASVVPTTGVHIVTIPSSGIVCYLQPECVIRPLKAAVTEDVLTSYGEGKVTKYDIENDMYTIQLAGGWNNAKLYCKGNAFDRVNDGIQDRDAAFGVNWLLRFLFSSSTSSTTSLVPRSRSNSIVSGSQSNRSVS